LDKDIDFTTRGWDNPGIMNDFGSYDIGADEAIIIEVFKNGFE